MEPLRPGECLQPLLLIPRRSEERSSSGPGGSGELFRFPTIAAIVGPGRQSIRTRRGIRPLYAVVAQRRPSDPDEFGLGSGGSLKRRVPLRA